MATEDKDLGPLPTVHPRYVPVAQAAANIGKAIEVARKQHELTSSELFCILAEEMAQLARWCVRTERRQKETTGG